VAWLHAINKFKYNKDQDVVIANEIKKMQSVSPKVLLEMPSL